MAQKASYLECCVFVNTPSHKLFVKDSNGTIVDVAFENLTSEEARVYGAVQDAFNQAVAKNGAFKYYLNICPLDYGNNMAITAQNGLFLVPAALIDAEYPDGTRKRYALGKDTDDKLFGANWKAENVYPYIRTLLLNLNPQNNETSLLCKLAPPLCNIGGWVWLGLALGATYKTTQARNVGKVAWGGASVVLWKEWLDRGGLNQLKETVGIGKYYDDDRIKPGSRVDQFWGKIKVDPRKLGVEDHQGPHYISVPDAIAHFKLYSIEFGNWLNQSDRLGFMYASLVTLRDMAAVVGIRQDRMGLNKTLSLAFGSRGRGGRAAAFYQPRYQVINLTKTHGAGTLCHEYAHAVDFYLGRHSGWRSARKQPEYGGKRKGSTAWLFENVMDGILWNDDDTPSTYHIWLSRQTPYYNMRTEIFARICEVYFMVNFKKHGIKNIWGVDGDRVDLPDAKLVEKVSGSLKKIFQKI